MVTVKVKQTCFQMLESNTPEHLHRGPPRPPTENKSWFVCFPGWKWRAICNCFSMQEVETKNSTNTWIQVETVNKNMCVIMWVKVVRLSYLFNDLVGLGWGTSFFPFCLSLGRAWQDWKASRKWWCVSIDMYKEVRIKWGGREEYQFSVLHL